MKRLLAMLQAALLRGYASEDAASANTPRPQVIVEMQGGEKVRVDRLQPFGFASRPADGEGVGIAVGGDRGDAAVMLVDTASHPRTLAKGDVAIYGAIDQPDREERQAICRITLSSEENNGILILASSGGVEIFGDAHITGNLFVTGKITAVGDIIAGGADGISLLEHTHTDTPGKGAGTTSPPNG